MTDLEYENAAGEKYRCEYDANTREWYARSIDIPWHVTRKYPSLSESILAADLGYWLPLKGLAS